MTNEEATQKTKQALASALKELMNKKPLDKITVTELVTLCNVNRKTFYYHFTDIYDLLQWMLENEAVVVIKQFDLLTDFEDAALYIIDYVEQNAHILNCAYDSMGRDQLKRFLDRDFEEVIKVVIDGYEEEEGLCVNPEYKNFLYQVYADVAASILISWFQTSDHPPKETLASYLNTLYESTIPMALRAGVQKYGTAPGSTQ